MNTPDWSRLFEHRKRIERRFGSIWQVPIARRYSDELLRLGGSGCRLLEVGAGDRALKTKLDSRWGDVEYFSCDIDASYPHDYHDLAEIDDSFDLVCAFEMIEHVTLPVAVDVVARSFALTRPGGYIALTTPNTFYPPAYLRDSTHITPFCYDELAGLLELCGYEVTRIVRLHHDPLLRKFLKRFLLYPLYRIVGIDFAHQVMVIGRRPENT